MSTTPLTINVDVDPAFERMADRDRRFRYVVLFVAAALVALAMVTCSCSTPISIPRWHAHAETRSVADRSRAVVLIENLCLKASPFTEMPGKFQSTDLEAATGSGTILDGWHVLTALHVVECSYAPVLRVTTFDGRHILARVERTDPGSDIARLELDEPAALGFAMPAIGRVKPDDQVCAFLAYPKRVAACGKVTDVLHAPNSNIWHTAPTEHGNSGLYNDAGELVGVVTRMRLCDPSDPWLNADAPGCGGLATSLATRHTDWFKP